MRVIIRQQLPGPVLSLLKATKMKEIPSMRASQSRGTFQDSMKFDTNYAHAIAYTYVHTYT